MFLLLSLAVGVYQISHVLGITVIDSSASRWIFNFSVAILFIGCFTVHWIAEAVERVNENKFSIISMYVGALVLSSMYLVFPDTFLLQSVSKLYFPNYYVAGPYYWLLIAYFIIAFFVAIRMLVKTYVISDSIHKNRLAYYIFALVISYPLATLGFFSFIRYYI